jgi:uncharacterized membrane protein
MRPRHLILLLLWAAVAFQYSHYYPLLPDTMASHFDGAGRPNGWSSKQAFFGLYLLLAALMNFVFFVFPKILGRFSPSLINIPNRAYWLVPARKDQALAMLDEEMGRFGIATLALMVAVIQLAIQANLPGRSTLHSGSMWVLLGGFAAYTVFWLARIHRRFRVPSEGSRLDAAVLQLRSSQPDYC